ncbi:MAG: 30S ribosomal protein S2 [Alphaproteobacteria bacterium]|nr:30S ribosomal protein S2 [Alphaproteobacteria bacterium]
MANLPQFTIRDLLEAGVHFGHRTYRWNPKMGPFIYGSRNGVHIIDLQKTVPMLYSGLAVLKNVASTGGRVLFVGTKTQAKEAVAEAAERSGQYYINHRWLGGMLTNWRTISASIKRLKDLEVMFSEPEKMAHLTKKERLGLEREFEKLQLTLGGIKNMGGIPDAIFVVDTTKEDIALAEARQLGIPVIGITDTNADPEVLPYPVPGNDDAARAIRLFTRLASDAVLAGVEEHLAKAATKASSAAASTSGGNNSRKSSVKLSPKAAAAAAATEATEEKAGAEKVTKVVKKAKETATKAPAKKTTAKKTEDAPVAAKETAAKKTATATA